MPSTLLVGAGALGSILARRAPPPLVIYDPDIVEARNAGAYYLPSDVGQSKATVTALRCGAEGRAEPFTIDTSLRGVGSILDATDSLASRAILNWRARQERIPLIIGTAAGTHGMVFPVLPDGPCWECVVHGKAEGEECAAGIAPETLEGVASAQLQILERILRGERVEQELTLITPGGIRHVTVRRHPACRTCAGVPPVIPKTAIQRCGSTGRLRALLDRQISLSDLPGTPIATYAQAVRLPLGEGSVLVHRHGLVEFADVERGDAERFLQRLRDPRERITDAPPR